MTTQAPWAGRDIVDRLRSCGCEPSSEDLADAIAEIERLRTDLWPRFEDRFIELDDIRHDLTKPLYERAEAEARRAELARTWDLVNREEAEAVSGE